MSVQSVSPLNSVNRSSAVNNQVNGNGVSKGQEKKEWYENKEAIALALGGLAVLGAITAGIIIHSRKPTGDSTKEAQEIFSSLKDVAFEKGVAKKDGELFTGVIKDTLKNGDSIELDYQNGQIVKSMRKGKENFVKEFDKGSVKTFRGDKMTICEKTTDGYVLSNEQGDIVRRYQKIGENIHRTTNTKSIKDVEVRDGKIYSRKTSTPDEKHSRTRFFDEKAPYRTVEEFRDKSGQLKKRVSIGEDSLTETFITEGEFAGRPKTWEHQSKGVHTTKMFHADGTLDKKLVATDMGMDKEGRLLTEIQHFDSKDKLTGVTIEHRNAGSSGSFAEEFDADKKLTRTINKTVVHSDENGVHKRTLVTEVRNPDGVVLNRTEEIINHN